MLFTAGERVCQVGEEDDSGQGLSAGELCCIHVVPVKTPPCPPELQRRSCGRARNREKPVC